jgi:hypothetical protein
MGYLICDKCGGYYELQSGESAEDFETCSCGGRLNFVDTIEGLDETTKKSETNKNHSNFGKDYFKEHNLKNRITSINSRINILTVIVGLAASVLVFILASLLLGVLGIAGDGITFYAIFTLAIMAFIGSMVTSFLGCDNLEDGGINGGVLSLILLISLGLIIGIFMFVMISVTNSIMASLGPLLSSVGSSTASKTASNDSFFKFLWNLFYGFIAIVLTFVAGVGGGSLGVIIKEKLNVQL